MLYDIARCAAFGVSILSASLLTHNLPSRKNCKMLAWMTEWTKVYHLSWCEVKLIVDIDPDNAYKEAQRHRGNNRCVATW